jgi:hypothetical protein
VKPKVEGKPMDVSCLLNETGKLNVKFSAIPKPTITWHRSDGSEVICDDRIQIMNDDNGQSTLIINNAAMQDSQAYTARATNKVGSVEAKVNFNVKGMSIDMICRRMMMFDVVFMHVFQKLNQH